MSHSSARIRVLRGLRALAVALGLSAAGATSAAALSVTYAWVPDAGFAGSGTIVLDDALITDPANFGFPGPVVPAGALVSLEFTFPENGLTFELADFNESQAVSGGWSAQSGQLTNTFDYVGQDLANGIQSVRVQSSGGQGLNDLVFIETEFGQTEAHEGTWQLVVVPEPATALLLAASGLLLAAVRRRC